MMHLIHALILDLPLNSMTYIRHMTTEYDARNTKLSLARLCPSLPGVNDYSYLQTLENLSAPNISDSRKRIYERIHCLHLLG